MHFHIEGTPAKGDIVQLFGNKVRVYIKNSPINKHLYDVYFGYLRSKYWMHRDFKLGLFETLTATSFKSMREIRVQDQYGRVYKID